MTEVFLRRGRCGCGSHTVVHSPSDGLVEWTVQQVPLATALSGWVAGATLPLLACALFLLFVSVGLEGLNRCRG